MTKILVVLLLSLFTFSCTKVKEVVTEVPVTVETIKYEYLTNYKVDTIIEKDSVDRYINGDSVILYKYKYIKQIQLQRDTICKIDTIPTVVTVTKTEINEVNKLTWYQKFLNWIGGIALVIGMVFGTYKIVKWKLK
jgi:hypothetical protein